MGIPWLYSKLAPHGKPTIFDGHDPCDSGGIIIDGPGLAFWLYEELHAQTYAHAGPRSRNPLPTYAALATFALQWLELIEAIICPIKYVLLDGILPDFKFSTRMERLQASLAVLKALKSARRHKKDFYVNDTLVDMEDSRYAHVTSPYHPGIVPGFVVSTVHEALLRSRYASRTVVVPGEADTACVDPFYLDDNDIILTGDTDLVVLNPPGRVIFFRDLKVSPGVEDAVHTVSALVHNPRELTAHFEVPDLIAWAFILKREPQLSLGDAATAANKLNLTGTLSSAYESFADQYNLPDREWTITNPALNQCLKQLGSRTTEVIHQALLSDTKQVRHFLPTLLDDPHRSSATVASRDIRTAAAALLLQLTPAQKTYAEVHRGTDKVEVTPASVPDTPDALFAALTALADSLDRYVKTQAPARSFRAFAVAHVLRWTARGGKTVPGRAYLHSLATGAQPICGWRELHLGAQVEATLDSLRFMRQILMVRAVVPAEACQVDGVVERLRETLALLPCIAQLMPYPCACLRLDASADRLDKILQRVYAEVEEEVAQAKSQKQRAEKAKRLAEEQKKKIPPNKSNNIFSMLQDSDIS